MGSVFVCDCARALSFLYLDRALFSSERYVLLSLTSGVRFEGTGCAPDIACRFAIHIFSCQLLHGDLTTRAYEQQNALQISSANVYGIIQVEEIRKHSDNFCF